MRPSVLRPVVAVLIAHAPLLGQEVHPDEMKLKPQIDAAISKGVQHLLEGQLRDGSWGGGNYPAGRTALRLYALLKCGLHKEHNAAKRALTYLDSVTIDKTYSIACAMLAYEATGDEKYRPRMRELLNRMVENQNKLGVWGYPNGSDLSNTQYAALGLWVGHKAGFKVPVEAWNNLIEGTIKHQETPHDVDVKVSKRTGVPRIRVAGFCYKPPKAGEVSATGTMTTAGVSILKICEIGLGKRMRRPMRRRVDEALQLGLNWFAAHFSVDHPQKPGDKRGQWLQYYLYGMERVGALTRQEQFGDHWWYVAGARKLLGTQNKKDGHWGRAGHDTCFALLFLRRATRPSGPISGGVSGGKERYLFAAGGPGADVDLRGAGQQPVSLYIGGFGEMLLAEHKQYGLRILRVEYFAGKRKLAELPGTPTKAWHNDTFLHRCETLGYGDHSVVAKVTAVDPEVPSGNTDKTVVIESKPMKVTIRDVIEPWMAGHAEMQSQNLLAGMGKKLVVKASSNQDKARQACDGQDSTHWLAAAKDRAPELSLEFAEKVNVRRLGFSQPLQQLADRSKVRVIRAVEVTFDDSKSAQRIDLDENPLAPTEFELRRPRRVKKMTVRIIECDGKADLPTGFAEVTVASEKRPNRK